MRHVGHVQGGVRDGGLVGGDRESTQVPRGTLDDQQVALGAGIDHARLLEDRELLGRPRHGSARLLQRRVQHRDQVVAASGGRCGHRCGGRGDGQDRAVNRHRHGTPRGLRRRR